MAIWSIGYVDREAGERQEPVEVLRVTAYAPDGEIESVIDTGAYASFLMACETVARQGRTVTGATPLSVAISVAGRGATLYEVLDDGTLRDWHKFVEPAISDGLEPIEELDIFDEPDSLSTAVPTPLRSTGWPTSYVVRPREVDGDELSIVTNERGYIVGGSAVMMGILDEGDHVLNAARMLPVEAWIIEPLAVDLRTDPS